VTSPAPAGPDPAERALIARLREGDEAAYEEMVRSQMGRLLAVVRRILRDDDEARDVVQETFVAAFRALPSFAGDSRLSTWLHRIAVNAALMRLRRRSRAKEQSLEALLPRFEDDGHHAVEPVDWSTPHDAAELGQRRAIVRAAIDGLPETSRTVLLLRDVEELDTAEVAELLGITGNAVKIRVHRARQAVRTVLDRRLRPETTR
jgi:RNA polymerase sigma-70 factor (ECF subfamily)